MALTSRIFSLDRLLIDYVFRVAICIAYGDADGDDEDSRNGVRNTVKSGGYCAAKTIPLIKPLALRVLQHPLTPATLIC